MKRTSLCLTLGAFLLAAACAGNNPLREETALDRNWGRAVESAKFNQILDPKAGGTDAPVEGLAGRPASYAVEKYEQSFLKEDSTKKPASTTISVTKSVTE